MLGAMRAATAVTAVLVACQSGPDPASPSGASSRPAAGALRFEVRFPATLSNEPLDGRLLLILWRGATEEEPRMLVRPNDRTAQVFGMDVEGWAPGNELAVQGEVQGYPLASFAALPADEYTVQAVLHRYETFRRADGHVVKLPPDRGEGQQWNLAPGNLLSTPRRLRVDAAAGGTVSIELDHAIPALQPIPDTEHLKHVTLKSELLSRFWGRDVHLSALVLLPEGWEAHPRARYPLVIYHSHFDRQLQGYRGTPPDPSLPKPDLEALRRECPNGHGEGCGKNGYERLVQEEGWRFHERWTGAGFPRVILVQIQHANPYYDDSYAVNSQNLGPYGDAITHELVPHLEQTYRGLGAWARGMYGGSTGGWEALAAQILYPDEYNGAIGCCPDPIDFTAYTTVDIYNDKNAYFTEGPLRRSPRIATRLDDGTLRSTMEQENLYELALGTRSRSGQQYDIWEAVYSPVGPDGYPRRIWDKQTGAIDPAVAAHWRDNYDLAHILTRDWATLGPKLNGKLWINVGLMDTYFLERAVLRLEDRVKALTNPKPDITFRYGNRDGHCWSGVPDKMNFQSRLTYHERFIPLLVKHFLRTAPKGADTRSWRY
jgi:hypothetical protein